MAPVAAGRRPGSERCNAQGEPRPASPAGASAARLRNQGSKRTRKKQQHQPGNRPAHLPLGPSAGRAKPRTSSRPGRPHSAPSGQARGAAKRRQGSRRRGPSHRRPSVSGVSRVPHQVGGERHTAGNTEVEHCRPGKVQSGGRTGTARPSNQSSQTPPQPAASAAGPAPGRRR